MERMIDVWTKDGGTIERAGGWPNDLPADRPPSRSSVPGSCELRSPTGPPVSEELPVVAAEALFPHVGQLRR